MQACPELVYLLRERLFESLTISILKATWTKLASYSHIELDLSATGALHSYIVCSLVWTEERLSLQAGLFLYF